MWTGTLYALAAGLMWGLVFVGPLLLPEYPAALQSVGRYLAFGLIALPLAWLDRRALARLSRADWIQALKLAAIGNLPQHLTPLNVDPGDGPPGGGFFGADCDLGALCAAFGISTSNVSMYLSDQQEALLGCGPFYKTDCDVDGIDLFNTEASVLLQALAGFEHKPVATRFKGNQVLTLPGARGPWGGDDTLVRPASWRSAFAAERVPGAAAWPTPPRTCACPPTSTATSSSTGPRPTRSSGS